VRWIAHQLAAAVRTAAPAALASTLLLAGCASTASQQYTDALSAWDSKQYARALAGAREAQLSAEQSKDDEVRDKSAYLAGLAAYQLGRMDDASRRLATAAASADKSLAGKATAMLGAVALEQSRWSDAATLYTNAADMLTGSEASDARVLARSAEERARASRPAAATAAAPASTTNASTPAMPARAPAALAPAASAPAKLTIVAGTYTSEVAARQRAGTLAEAAKRAGTTAPRVVSSTAGDRRVWQVEIGAFDSRAQAEAVLKKMPSSGCTVAPSLAR
jgi:hypothetical protein